MFSWCSWNVRGLGDPAKLRAVRSFIHSNWVGFWYFLEITVREDRFGLFLDPLVGIEDVFRVMGAPIWVVYRFYGMFLSFPLLSHFLMLRRL